MVSIVAIFLPFYYTQIGQFLTNKWSKLGHFGHFLARLTDFQHFCHQKFLIFCFFPKIAKKYFGQKLCNFGPEMRHTRRTPYDGLFIIMLVEMC